MIRFLYHVGVNTTKGFGNILLNGFESDLSSQEKELQIPITMDRFNIFTAWEDDIAPIEILKEDGSVKELGPAFKVDLITKDRYSPDSKSVVRSKCAALFFASLVAQPIGLTLNLMNKIGKVATLSHFWKTSAEPKEFFARTGEFIKDIFVIALTPLLYLGMLFSTLYGAVISPFNGRKLFATLERFAYMGSHQFFKIGHHAKPLHNYLLAPCFQPSFNAHLGGGAVNKSGEW